MEDRTEIGRLEANFMSFIHMIQKTPLYSEVVMYTVTMNYWTMPGITTPLLQSILALLINIASEHHMHPLETIEQVDAPISISGQVIIIIMIIIIFIITMIVRCSCPDRCWYLLAHTCHLHYLPTYNHLQPSPEGPSKNKSFNNDI